MERFIEGDLPIVASDDIFGLIDEATIREENGAVWFDRQNWKLLVDDPELRESMVARETYKLPLTGR